MRFMYFCFAPTYDVHHLISPARRLHLFSEFPSFLNFPHLSRTCIPPFRAEGGQHAGGIRDLGDEPSPTSAGNTPQTEPDAGGVGVASVVEVPPLSEGLFTLVKGDGTSHLVELCC